MKKIIFVALTLFCFVVTTKAQAIYDNSGNKICFVQSGAFYKGSQKVGFIQQGVVYSNYGKVGYVQGSSLYDNSGNVICYVQGDSFYNGGKKIGFVQQGIIYDGSGNRIASFQGMNMMDIAIFYFSLN